MNGILATKAKNRCQSYAHIQVKGEKSGKIHGNFGNPQTRPQNREEEGGHISFLFSISNEKSAPALKRTANGEIPLSVQFDASESLDRTER